MICLSFLRWASIVKSLPDTNPNATLGMNNVDRTPPDCDDGAIADVLTRFVPAILSTVASVIIAGLENPIYESKSGSNVKSRIPLPLV